MLLGYSPNRLEEPVGAKRQLLCHAYRTTRGITIVGVTNLPFTEKQVEAQGKRALTLTNDGKYGRVSIRILPEKKAHPGLAFFRIEMSANYHFRMWQGVHVVERFFGKGTPLDWRTDHHNMANAFAGRLALDFQRL